MTTQLQLKDFLLTDPKEVKRVFEQNELSIIDRLHPDLPLRYKIDFIRKAQLTGADYRLNQIHLTSYFSSRLGHKVGVTVFSYHFFLNQANRTGEYEGVNVTSEVEDVFNPIKGETQKELVATATVFRKGKNPTTFKARWSECYNSKNDIWKSRPYQMLEKTAIANALRWAFPEALSGMFIEEEINAAHVEEKILEAEKEDAIEATVKNIGRADKMLIEATTPGNKQDIISEIKVLADNLTSHMKINAKVAWFLKELGVQNPDELNKKTKQQLLDLSKKLAQQYTEPQWEE